MTLSISIPSSISSLYLCFSVFFLSLLPPPALASLLIPASFSQSPDHSQSRCVYHSLPLLESFFISWIFHFFCLFYFPLSSVSPLSLSHLSLFLCSCLSLLHVFPMLLPIFSLSTVGSQGCLRLSAMNHCICLCRPLRVPTCLLL